MLALPVLLGLVVADANVYTLDPARPHARHVAIVDGRFAYVGDDLGAARRAAGPGAEQLDAAGATVVPGFNDAHVHFGLSFTLGAEDAIDLGAGVDDRATLERRIRAAAARPVGPERHDWIFVTVRALPTGIATGADLPHIARPLFVVTEHGGLLNLAAQRRLGLGREDAPAGQVRGRLLPAALDRVVKSLPRPVLAAAARRFLAEAARVGITSVQLMDELPELFEALRREGALTLRVRMIAFGFRFETPRYVPRFAAPDPDWVRLDAVKYFDDDWARLPRTDLMHLHEDARATALPIVVHVLSRAALGSLLDQLERLEAAAPGGAVHFRLDHVDEATPEQAARIHKLGLVVCSNPAMLPEWRSERAFPMRTLLDAGVTLCMGSDFVGRHAPARPLAPLSAIAAAVTHGGFGTQERISAEDALRAFTTGSAAAEARTDKGAIRTGALGDLVGLTGDPLTAAPDAVAQLDVRFTVVGGRVVYARRAPPPVRPPPSSIGPGDRPTPPRQPPPSSIGPPSAPPDTKK